METVVVTVRSIVRPAVCLRVLWFEFSYVIGQVARMRAGRVRLALMIAVYGLICLLALTGCGSKLDEMDVQALKDSTLALIKRGECSKTEDYLQYIARNTKKVYGRASPEYAKALIWLGSNYRDCMQIAKADSMFSEVISLYPRWDLDRIRAQAYFEKGMLRTIVRKYADAESLLTESLEIRLRVHGPVHPDVAETYDGLQMCSATRGDWEATAAYLRGFLKASLPLTGLSDTLNLRAIEDLGQAYESVGRCDSVSAIMKRYIPRIEEIGSGSERFKYLAAYYDCLGSCAMWALSPREALTAYQHSLHYADAANNYDSLHLFYTLCFAARAAMDLARDDLSDSLFQRTMSVGRAAAEVPDSLLSLNLRAYASLKAKMGQAKAARVLEEEADSLEHRRH
jgi:tetratricopeptide (TPR) repeat protein